MAKYLRDHSADTLFVYGSLETLLPTNSVARQIWAALCELDFSRFDRKYRNDDEGRPAIDPRRVVGVWILATMRGITSSVEVARLCETDVEMRWMSGGAQLGKSTFCHFRKAHIDELKHLSTQILAALALSGMLPGEELAVDGTVIRAAASCRASCTRGQLKRRVEKLDKLIEHKLAQPDDVDVERVERLAKRKARFERALAEMAELGLNDDDDRMTITEPEAGLKKLKDKRYAPAHNIQNTTGLGGGAIVTTEVVEQGSDQGQFERQMNNAIEEIDRVKQMLSQQDGTVGPVSAGGADSAYHDTLQLARLEGKFDTFVPDGQSKRRPSGVAEAFVAEAFNYDAESDTMICPEGHPMKRRKYNKRKTALTYQAEARVCNECRFKPQCSPRSKEGRCVNRPLYEDVVKAVAERVDSERGKRFKRARWVVMEGAFARLVEHLNWRRCRTWGRTGAQAEALWRQITHNLMLLIGRWKPLVPKEAEAG